jgi:hypothetical protein
VTITYFKKILFIKEILRAKPFMTREASIFYIYFVDNIMWIYYVDNIMWIYYVDNIMKIYYVIL